MTATYDFNPLIAQGPVGKSATSDGKTHHGCATILVIEKLPAFRSHLISVLQQELKLPVKFVQTESGNNAIEMVAALRPDLVVMDVALPAMNGIEIAKKIWAAHHKAKVLFWSNSCGEAHLRALALLDSHEAHYGFILKSSSDDDLVYAANSLLVHHHPYIDPSIRSSMAHLVRAKQWLSDVELEMLRDVALGLTDKAIAIRRHISERGVQNRISALYKKLLFSSSDDATQKLPRTVELVNLRVRLVFEAIRLGWIVPEEIPGLNSDFHCWIGQTLAKPHRQLDRSMEIAVGGQHLQ